MSKEWEELKRERQEWLKARKTEGPFPYMVREINAERKGK